VGCEPFGRFGSAGSCGAGGFGELEWFRSCGLFHVGGSNRSVPSVEALAILVRFAAFLLLWDLFGQLWQLSLCPPFE